jgi:DNA invertase Pin-like site-specific DNA recombinase
MRKAYSYIRMSTNIQLKGDSLRRQLETSKKYAFDNKLELVESIDGVELKDIGVSAFKGANAEKGALSIFLQLLEDGKIERDSILLIESLDRLSRNKITSSLLQFMDILDKGIEIVTLLDGQTYTKEKLNREPSSLFISIGVMIRANEESETKSNRLSSAWKNKRNHAATKVLTKTLPAWIKYNETTEKLEPIKDRTKVIKQIFDMCIETCGLYGIAKHLNESKVPVFGKGKIWYRSYISKIINNRAVLGEFQPHKFINGKRQPEGECIPDYFPKLIDEHTFHLAHASIARRNNSDKGRKGENFVNIFSGIAYCGGCGSKMSARNRGRKNAKTLICTSKKEGGSCATSELDMKTVEDRVLTHLLEVDFGKIINKHESKSTAIQAEITSLKKQKEALNQEAENLLDLSSEDDLNAAAKKRLTSRLNHIENQLQIVDADVTTKEVELASELELRKKVDSTKLKEFIRMFKSNDGDYMFRSSINQLLAKSITRITFQEIGLYNLWDKVSSVEFLDENDIAITTFRKENPALNKLPFKKLIANRQFKKYAQTFNNVIEIDYRTGTSRTIFFGENKSNAETKLEVKWLSLDEARLRNKRLKQ